MDPKGCVMRKQHKLKRRVYRNPRPNAVWHAEGYDKLKPYGFAVHGCIDGWSRKLVWLFVTPSNNSPDNIASYYLETVDKFTILPFSVPKSVTSSRGNHQIYPLSRGNMKQCCLENYLTASQTAIIIFYSAVNAGMYWKAVRPEFVIAICRSACHTA